MTWEQFYRLLERFALPKPRIGGELPPASRFENCLGMSSDEARFDCLRATVISGDVLCNEGWLVEGI